jgi:hypothetical protein
LAGRQEVPGEPRRGPGAAARGDPRGKGEALEERHAGLAKRLGQKEAEKDRYVRMYAQGHLDDSELATYLEDLKYQTQNLRLLLDSVEAEIAGKKEQRHLVETTASWLAALRERVAEVEADTEEAQVTRRELVRLLVETVEVDRTEEGRTRVRVTYRFGPPAGELPSPAQQNGEAPRERIHVESNSLEYDNPLVPLVSVVAGLVVGELLGIEDGLKRFGDRLEKRFSRGESPVSRAFVVTGLLFCVGPLTVIGSLEDGLRGDYSLLALKSALDFIAALTFASVLGWGVLLSAGTVLVVQGSLTLGAAFLDAVVTEPMISATTATGASLSSASAWCCSTSRRSGSPTCSPHSSSLPCSSRPLHCGRSSSGMLVRLAGAEMEGSVLWREETGSGGAARSTWLGASTLTEYARSSSSSTTATTTLSGPGCAGSSRPTNCT